MIGPDTTASRVPHIETLDCPEDTGVYVIPRGLAAAIGKPSQVYTDYYPVRLRIRGRVRFYSFAGPGFHTFLDALTHLTREALG